VGKYFFNFSRVVSIFQKRSGEEMQRKEKEQGIEQIYTQISIIMGN
jgi:hypothetical protein